jgi:hypothetical protein
MKTLILLSLTTVVIFGCYEIVSDTENAALMHPIFALDVELCVGGIALLASLIFRQFSLFFLPVFATTILTLILLEGDGERIKSYPNDRTALYHQAAAEYSLNKNNFEQADYHYKQQGIVNVNNDDLRGFINPKAARRALANIGVIDGYALLVSQGFQFKKYKMNVSVSSILGAVANAKNDCDAALGLLEDAEEKINCKLAYTNFQSKYSDAKSRLQLKRDREEKNR